jgi:hypothetical protein
MRTFFPAGLLAEATILLALFMAVSVSRLYAQENPSVDSTEIFPPVDSTVAVGDSTVATDSLERRLPVSEEVASLPPVVFSGTSRLYGQLANRQGSFQETPEDFARLELAPSLAFYGAPFTLNVLLSTEQASVRQNINSISIDFDYSRLQGVLMQRAIEKIEEIEAVKQLAETEGGIGRLRDSLGSVADEKIRQLEEVKEYADLDKLREKAITESVDQLDKLGIISGAEKIFMNFPSLSFGVTYPNYTALTLSGVPVTGANIEWNPGNLYLAVAGGQTQRAIRLSSLALDSVRIDPAFKRNLYAARVGFGRKSGGHFYLTGIYTRDDEGSIPLDTNGRKVTPTANYVVGMEVNMPLFDDYFLLQGEAVGSLLTGDLEASDLAGKDLQDVPSFLVDALDPKISSVVDYAFNVRSTLRIPETDSRIFGSIRLVGPAFHSLGVPALRSDQLRYDARIEQKLWRRQILVTGFVRREKDNVFPWKTSTTTISAFGIGLGLNIRRLPYLRLEFAPYTQRYTNTLDTTDIVNQTSTLSATTGYSYLVAGTNASTTLMYSAQNTTTFQGLADYRVGTFSALQSVALEIPLEIQAGVNLSTLSTGGDSSNSITSFDFGASYRAWDVWTTAAGLTLADQAGQGNNLGFYLITSLPIKSYGTVELRAERNVYKSFTIVESSFNEFLLTMTYTTLW